MITAVEAAHIGYFGSIEAIADEKSAVGDGLPPDGIAVLPADSPMLGRLAPRAARIDTFGIAQVIAMHPDQDGTDVEAQFEDRRCGSASTRPARTWSCNALAALTAANALGIDGSAAIAAFRPVAGRGLRRELTGGIRLLDESYNANGASVRAALAVLRRCRAAAWPCWATCWNWADGPAEHAALAGRSADSADLVFTCGPLMRGLFDALPAAVRGGHAADSAALAPVVAAAVRPGDAVLVKGSLGSRMATVVRALEGVG